MTHDEKNQGLLLHLDAGYNLARWLLKNEQDAKDVVQESFIRAFRFKGPVENIKTWFLTTVRNTAYSSLKKRLPIGDSAEDFEQLSSPNSISDPEAQALRSADLEMIQAALLLVSEDQREIFVLREIEELSYQELAEILQIPVGTVMSRLARARAKILATLQNIESKKRGGPYDKE